MFSVDGYLVNPDSKDFTSLPTWDVEILGKKFFWAPNYPYLTARSVDDDSRRIIEQISNMIESQGLFSEDEVILAGPSGVEIKSIMGSPYAVRNAIEFIYGGEDEGDVIFSKNAPTFQDDLDDEERTEFEQGTLIT